MTKQEILKKSVWDDSYALTIDVYHKEFDQNVSIYVFPIDDYSKKINSNVVTAINEFLDISKDDLDKLKSNLYEHYKMCCESISYGNYPIQLKNGESESEANYRFFGIYNKQEAFDKSTLGEVTIEAYEDREVNMYFNTIWETEHGCLIKIFNGKIKGIEG